MEIYTDLKLNYPSIALEADILSDFFMGKNFTPFLKFPHYGGDEESINVVGNWGSIFLHSLRQARFNSLDATAQTMLLPAFLGFQRYGYKDLITDVFVQTN